MTTGLVRSRESRSKRLRPSPGPSCRPLSPHRSGVAHCLWSSRWRCCWWVPVYFGTFSDANPRLRGPSATSFLLSNLGQRLAQGASPSIAISPDGTHVAYTAGQGADTQLYLRAQDAFDARPMPGTEGAEGPFFSPDGQWVAFYSKSTLFKLPVDGGKPEKICDASWSFLGASWGPDDTIVFGTPAEAGLWRCSASGGSAETLTRPDKIATPTSVRM